MNGFQWMACTALGVALVRDLRRLRRSPPAALRTSRVVVWSAAIVAIAQPALVTRVANALGIGRGADIVLYVVALAFVALAFHFYAQHTRLRRDLSALASHIALQEATRGGKGR